MAHAVTPELVAGFAGLMPQLSRSAPAPSAEDVVVDQGARGRGIGEALTLRALELAAEGGARTVDLTSRPEREAANRLYQRLGFQLRDSRLFRYSR